MTTDKKRVTIWLRSTAELETLYDALRLLAPIGSRGAITRSTITEAAVGLALADLHEHGAQSAIFQALVNTGNVTLGNEAQP